MGYGFALKKFLSRRAMASLGEKRRKQNKKAMLKGRKMAMLVKISLGYKGRTCLKPQTKTNSQIIRL